MSYEDNSLIDDVTYIKKQLADIPSQIARLKEAERQLKAELKEAEVAKELKEKKRKLEQAEKDRNSLVGLQNYYKKADNWRAGTEEQDLLLGYLESRIQILTKRIESLS